MSELQFMEPGIYFGMSDEVYHADPSFSASGIKDIVVSPLDYWMKSAMNPNKVDKSSDAKELGKAYHKLILEGEKAFHDAYAVEPCEEDHDGLLKTGDQLKARCKELGLKASGTLAEMSERIREVDAVVPLWSEIMSDFEEEAAGKERITRANWLRIQTAHRIIGQMESIKGMFENGMAEVAIFWRHPTGVRMKCKVDYLKLQWLIDLKSFANKMSKPIDDAVTGELFSNRYFVQPVVYQDGLAAAKRLYAKHGAEIVHGDVDMGWLDAVMKTEKHRFAFLFQQTGDCPNALAREFGEFERFGAKGTTHNAYWTQGEMAYRYGVETYRRFMDLYGPHTPWVADHGFRPFRDEDFKPWMLDERYGSIEEDAA
jgi:hypothetical protein